MFNESRGVRTGLRNSKVAGSNPAGRSAQRVAATHRPFLPPPPPPSWRAIHRSGQLRVELVQVVRRTAAPPSPDAAKCRRRVDARQPTGGRRKARHAGEGATLRSISERLAPEQGHGTRWACEPLDHGSLSNTAPRAPTAAAGPASTGLPDWHEVPPAVGRWYLEIPVVQPPSGI